jgi:hypothetical protein
VGAKKFERVDYEQAWDYGLDLKNFHAPSHAAAIFPILCATEARDSDRRWKPPHADGVRPPFCCSGESLGRAVRLALEHADKKVPATIFTSDAATPPDAAKMVAGSFLPLRIGVCRNKVKAFIQNVHHFRDDTLRDPAPPDDRVVVFDEAQRAWDARQLASFMKRKKGRPEFTQSESELLLSALDRHNDWAVVVCLVGGGQEINTGEAGIGAWLESVRTAFPGWDVFISPHLTDSEYAATGALARLTESRVKTVPATIFPCDPATPPGAAKMVAGTLFPDTSPPGTLTTDPSLHLATSMRSFRAESLSRFVKALLDGEAEAGRELLESFREQYPIVLTRSMRAARRWMRQQRRGTERAGLVASSSAQRLKPHAIDLFAVDAAPPAGMQDREPDDLFAPVTHDDVVRPELAVGCLCPRFEVHVDHVRRLVIGALHRSMRSLENGRDRVKKIAQLDGGHTCRLRLKIAATREVTNAVITKPSWASTSL